MASVLAVLGFLAASAAAAAQMEVLNPGYFPCSNGSNAQPSLDLDQVLGMWYAVEIVNHRDDGRQAPGRSVVNSCPVIFLNKHEPNMIKLLWKEKPGDIEFTFLVHDLSRPGYWLSSGPQNGSMLYSTGTYRQFAGTVEVTKAVGTHMVLTFCAPSSELYSVVMSRQLRLPKAELRGVNKMLEFRGLAKFNVREACKDSATQAGLSLLLMVLALFLANYNRS